MANTRTQRRENELPYIPFGPFQIRLPFIHYKIESVEFIQGLILGVTALAAVPYLEQYLGLPYELAWSCVIIETFLYLLHSLLGDPACLTSLWANFVAACLLSTNWSALH